MSVACAALSLTACSRSLPHPMTVAQPTSALSEVTAPPPPGRIEIIPPRPSRTAVWIDGEWSWRVDRWAWKPGGWVEPPAGERFAPWVFVRGADGRLWYAAGTWRDGSGQARAAPPVLAKAVVESTQVVNAGGAIETTAVVK